MRPIRTYVFIDLETTGLPREENNRTKITELSMIAVKREHLLNTAKGESPRVQNKLTLCFNPQKFIQPKGSEVTGLCNILLEHEMTLNKHSFELIDTFLSLLTQPVCLIAHNGNNFDYPILKNNLEKLNVNFSSDVKCADCFFAFYDILETKDTAENGANETAFEISNIGSELRKESRVKRRLDKDFNSGSNLVQNVDNTSGTYKSIKDSTKTNLQIRNTSDNIQTVCGLKYSTEAINNFPSNPSVQMSEINDNTPKQDVPRIASENSISLENSTKTNSSIDTCDATIITLLQSLKDFVDDEILKIISDSCQHVQKTNGSTPKQNNIADKNSMKPTNYTTIDPSIDTCDAAIALQKLKDSDHEEVIEQVSDDPKYQQKTNESTPKQKIIPLSNSFKRGTKRRFPWNKNAKSKSSYKLAKIYKRQLNRESPEAHRAENDCVMAMEIAVTVGEQFVEWVDNYYTDFKDVVPMTIGVKL